MNRQRQHQANGIRSTALGTCQVQSGLTDVTLHGWGEWRAESASVEIRLVPNNIVTYSGDYYGQTWLDIPIKQ